MSMARLLAAGRSLIGAQNVSNRYRLDARARLPKFGSSKNPFAPETRTPVPLEPIPPRPTMATTTPVIRTMEPSLNLTPAPPATTRLRQAVRRLHDWCVEANPIPRLAGPARSVFKPASRIPGAPIQSDLSLDEVKVVRNDLSDADLEIVPAKPARRADLAPIPEQNAWSRLTTRILVRAERD